jgi:uncharacterized protein YjiS (DUF1127 family)
MTCIEAIAHETTPRVGTILKRSRAGARRYWRAYWNWRARKATIRILQSLDDRTLKDIGVHPSEITSLVYDQRCEHTRHYG